MKTLNITVFLLLCNLISYGQFSIGPIVGLNRSTQSLSTSYFEEDPYRYPKEVNYLNGMEGGIAVQYLMYPKVILQGEVLYTQMGYETEVPYQWIYNNDIFESTETYRLNYLKTPFSLKYLLTQKNLRPFVQGGLYVGYLVNGKFSKESEHEEWSTSDDYNITFGKHSTDKTYLNANRIDWGMQIGTGLDYKKGKHAFSLEILYSQGLRFAQKTYEVEAYGTRTTYMKTINSNSRNKSFLLRLGYFIDL